MRRISIWIWFGAVLAGWVPLQTQPGPPPGSLVPLLNVDAELRFTLLRTDLYRGRLFVATNGTTDGNRSLAPMSLFWETARASARASESQLAALQQALTAGRIGLRNGRCSLVRPFGWFGTYTTYWYGAGGRFSQLTVEVGNVATSTVCPSAVSDLIRAIDDYSVDVLGFSIAGQAQFLDGTSAVP